MSKKQLKEKPLNRIEIGERRIPKKKTEQQNPFSRIKLHPLEELEGRENNDNLNESVFNNESNDLDLTSYTSISSTTAFNDRATPLPKPQPLANKQLDDTAPDRIPVLDQLDILVQPLSPLRDFQKIPNSVTREALPSGLFRGKSKQVWDYLWSVSRGSIKPTRIARKSRKEIMKAAGIGSMVTVDAALLHLELTGLLRKISAIGSSIGNEYEIFTPEEVTLMSQMSGISSSYTSTSSSTSPIQKMVHLDVPESGTSSTTQTVENKDTYSLPNTFFKTEEKTIDDDRRYAPLAGLLESLEKVFRELTGKGIEQKDESALTEIAELLADELRVARLNTKSISSPAAFLAKHLKNRLTMPSAKLKANAVKPDTVGRTEEEERNKSMDLSTYTPAELEELEKEFCLLCGKRHEECTCSKTSAEIKQ